MRELRPNSEQDAKALAQLVKEFSRVEALELDGGGELEVEALAALQRLPCLRRLTLRVCGTECLRAIGVQSCHVCLAWRQLGDTYCRKHPKK